MRWLIVGMTLIGLAVPTGAQPSQPVEVMVIGAYHFDNPGRDIHNPRADDVLKPKRQRELERVAVALADFRPTKIMVERIVKTSDLIDPRYAEFSPADLAKNRDERVQIAYRLANRLGHKVVYGIDEQPGDGEPDYFPFDKVMGWAKSNGAADKLSAVMAEGASVAAWIEQLQKEGTIGHAMLEINRPERTMKDQSFYYELLRIGNSEQQPGADLNAMWYLRNAKIFAKLMTVANPGDRILVVYGSGHNYWLRHFSNTAPGYRSIDPTPFLQKAAR